MSRFVLFAQPWWVNLLILVPFASYYFLRKRGLRVSPGILLGTAVFGLAFGFVEASVVVYLRAAVGLLPGFESALAESVTFSATLYEQEQLLKEMPRSLLRIEIAREAATMVMLLSVAYSMVRSAGERFAVFLWTFAIWDIAYYVGLRVTVGWPESLLTPDILFLIPSPWISQVWYPITVSGLSIIAVILARRTVPIVPD